MTAVLKRSVTVAIAVLAVGWLAAPASAAARPDYGVVTQSWLFETDFERMEDGGVDTLRFLIRWRQVEPTPGSYDWSSVDAVVGGARTRGIRLLPVVYGTPEWIAEAENHAPLDDAADRAAWGGFLTALAARYGPGGSYFAGGPERPIRRWQIWNEPNFDFYWEPPQSAAAYGRLVKLSARSLRAVDPNARIVLAGVAAVHAGVPWAGFLRELYAVPGIERSFDFVALHPYAPNIPLLRAQIERIRRLISRAGDRRTPLAVTEIGWASDGERPRPLVVGPRAQAWLLGRSFRLLSDRGHGWHISDVQWYAWQDTHAVEPLCVFCEYAGLFDLNGHPKPAWHAYRRAVGSGRVSDRGAG